jgi:hypothetical protein
MTSVTFPAWEDDRYHGLDEILAALDDLVRDLRWRVRIDESTGPGSNGLETLSPDSWLDTQELLSATRDVQLIDGHVSGFRSEDHETPYLTIRAVDSTWWDVESPDDVFAEFITKRHPQARLLPADRQ